MTSDTLILEDLRKDNTWVKVSLYKSQERYYGVKPMQVCSGFYNDIDWTGILSDDKTMIMPGFELDWN